jgi:hypothetical protein
VLGTRARPYLNSVDDLAALVREFDERGDTPVLAYTGNSPSEMLLNELANTSDELRLADFDLVPVDQSATAFDMLRRDEAQVAITWEPDTTAARGAGYAIGLDSSDVPDSIVDVVVASDELIERDPAAVQAMVSAFYRRMDHMLDRPSELTIFYADDGGLDALAARSLLAGITLYGTADADTFMNADIYPLDTPQVEQSVGSIGSTLALVNPEITLDRAKVDGQYVRAHAAEQGIAEPTTEREGGIRLGGSPSGATGGRGVTRATTTTTAPDAPPSTEAPPATGAPPGTDAPPGTEAPPDTGEDDGDQADTTETTDTTDTTDSEDAP